MGPERQLQFLALMANWAELLAWRNELDEVSKFEDLARFWNDGIIREDTYKYGGIVRKISLGGKRTKSLLKLHEG
jgi:hypothetical protein